jgi:hypothetical protein
MENKYAHDKATKTYFISELDEETKEWQADTMTTVGKRLLRLFLEDRGYSYGHKGRLQFIDECLEIDPLLTYDTITKPLGASILEEYTITKTANKLKLSNRDINQLQYILHKNLYAAIESLVLKT